LLLVVLLRVGIHIASWLFGTVKGWEKHCGVNFSNTPYLLGTQSKVVCGADFFSPQLFDLDTL
jgi:hypothetical protein